LLFLLCIHISSSPVAWVFIFIFLSLVAGLWSAKAERRLSSFYFPHLLGFLHLILFATILFPASQGNTRRFYI